MSYRIFSVALLFFAAFLPARATTTDSLGLPGDHLDLTAVLELFQKAQSPEDFEKALNSKDSKVNNLDLNGDKLVDYIRVVDHSDGNAHVIVLQVPVNEKETQDVAVIEIEKKGDAHAELQIIGDEELYGDKYIVEPKQEDQTIPAEGKFRAQQVVFVNVWYWPCVQYVWYPAYHVWVSPWYWMYYPGWWYGWEPVPYVVYYEWVYIYHPHYYWCDDYRMHEAHTYYAPRRTTSPVVERKYEAQHKNYEGRKNTLPARNPNAQPAPSKSEPRPAERPKETPAAPKQGTAQPAPAPQPKQQQPAPAPRPKSSPAPKVTPAPQPAPQPRVQPPPQSKPGPQPAPRPKGGVRPRKHK